MAHAWTEKTWKHLEIGFASDMQLLADNDEVLLDVIRGDNGEGSGWPGHSHKKGSTWGVAQTTMGDQIAAASKTLRGGVTLKDIDHVAIAGGGGSSFWDFPQEDDGISNYDWYPLAFFRRDTNAGGHGRRTDYQIGHDGTGAGANGFYWKTLVGASLYWRTTAYNHYPTPPATMDFLSTLLSHRTFDD